MAAIKFFILFLVSICLCSDIWCEENKDGATVTMKRKEFNKLRATVGSLKEQAALLNHRYDALQSVSEKYKDEVKELQEKLAKMQTVENRSNKPAQSKAAGDYAFMAGFSEYMAEVPNPMVFDSVVTNPGGHYDPLTGIYTVPANGIYEFNVHVRNSGDDAGGVFINAAGSEITNTFTYDPDYLNQSTRTSIILPLNAGDQVYCRPNSLVTVLGTDSEGTMFSWFGGYMIQAS